MTRSQRAGLLAGLAACALLVGLYSRDWGLPGLYVDAVNPEYLIPGIVDPPGSLVFSVPGNRLGGRFPVFTTTLYHGSVQLYAALPFMAVFGTSHLTLRLFQLLVGLAILLLALALARRGRIGAPAVVALCAAGTLAAEPSFVLALRTQAYSILFSVIPLLASVWLLLGWRAARRPRLHLFLSGALFGIATFGYFVIAFFLPAMIWLALRRDAAHETRPARRWRAPALWLGGVVVGELPFILGIVLLATEVGGLGPMADYLGDTGSALQQGSGTSGPLSRLDTMLGFFWSAATSEWPQLQILQLERSGPLDDVKAGLLVGLPLLCLALRIGSRAERRALAVPISLVASYLVGSYLVLLTSYAGRIGGHHFPTVMPLLYLAFGMACATLWPAHAGAAWRRATRSWADVARGAGVGAAILAVLTIALVSQERLHRDLSRTGGASLYSDAIDRFAASVDRETPDATIHAPDFGFQQSLAFLSDASPIRPVVQVGEIQTLGCSDKPQLVVLDHVRNKDRLGLLSRLIGPPMHVATWFQRDGRPVFQVARFGGGRACAGAGPGLAPGAGPALALDPPAFPVCSFLGQGSVVRVRWRAGPGVSAVALVATPPGGPAARWATGRRRGAAQTGPWAVPGMAFTLVDPATSRILARAVLARSPCPLA